MIGLGSHATTLEISRLTRWGGEAKLARGLAGLAVASVVILLFAPWQQNAVGTGQVIAFSPNERELEIEAPIEGRVVRWRFQEGDRVERGDVIVELADNDPQVIQRYETERDAVLRRIEAAEASIELLVERVDSLDRMRTLALESADTRIRAAERKVRAAELVVDAAKARRRAAEQQVVRMAQLASEGLMSQRDHEVAERNVAEARAGALEAQADLEAAQADVSARRAERQSRAADLMARNLSAADDLQSARARLATYQEELARVERALARQRSLLVRAPHPGMLTRVRAREGSAFVKQGETLALLVPETARRAVELMVSGVDAPLVVPGQPVQLQFEGWPAIQFGGWPEAAVGTFSGQVAFVEAGASPQGRFRAVVVPTDESEWPPAAVLRQGNLANGWVLLNEVSLGYELWRKLNGFPADLPSDTARIAGIKAKAPKP